MNAPSQQKILTDYYIQSTNQYKNWGSYEDGSTGPSLPDIYALHAGYYPVGKSDEVTQRQSIRNMDVKILQWLALPSRKLIYVGDFGCGTGSVAFQISMLYPNARVLGLTISENHARTAEEFVQRHRLSKVQISIGDYMEPPYPKESLDYVIFIESLMHSQDPELTIAKALSVLKPGGILHFQEPLLRIASAETEELRRHYVGFCLPAYMKYPINTFVQMWKRLGARDVFVIDATPNIFPSAKLVGDHAQMRLEENPNTSEPELTRRLGAKYLRDLMMGYENGSNTIGYYIVQARKE